MSNWNPTTARAKAMDRLEDQNKALRARVAELETALTFYADRNAWSKGTVDAYLVDASIFDWPGDLGDEPWDIARKALAGEEGE